MVGAVSVIREKAAREKLYLSSLSSFSYPLTDTCCQSGAITFEFQRSTCTSKIRYIAPVTAKKTHFRSFNISMQYFVQFDLTRFTSRYIMLQFRDFIIKLVEINYRCSTNVQARAIFIEYANPFHSFTHVFTGSRR